MQLDFYSWRSEICRAANIGDKTGANWGEGSGRGGETGRQSSNAEEILFWVFSWKKLRFAALPWCEWNVLVAIEIIFWIQINNLREIVSLSPGGCGHAANARLIAWGLLFGQTAGKQQFISRLIARLLDSYQMDIILLHAWSTILQGNNKFLSTSEISGIKKSILAFGVIILPTKGNYMPFVVKFASDFFGFLGWRFSKAVRSQVLSI